MRFRSICSALVFLMLTAASSQAEQLTVAAPRGFKRALKEVSRFFEKGNPGWEVSLEFGKPNELTRRIETGAGVDVLVTTDEEKLDSLDQKGLLIKGSRLQLVASEAILIASAKSELILKELNDLTSDKVKAIAMLKDTTPMGRKSRKCLKSAGLLDTLQPKLVEATDMPAAMAMVQKGTADCTFAHTTDAEDATMFKILLRIPESEIPAIRYSAAIPSASKNQEKAGAFLTALRSTSAKSIFENAGFRVITSAQTQTSPSHR